MLVWYSIQQSIQIRNEKKILIIKSEKQKTADKKQKNFDNFFLNRFAS